MERKFDPKQVLMDRRSVSADLVELERFLRAYTGRKFNWPAYEKSFEIVKGIVDYCQDSMSDEDRIAHKILVDDVWIWYKDLRNPSRPCPGEKKAVRYIKMHDRLHPECERCRKILVFDFDDNFLKKITEKFLAEPFTFDFKIARDLGVFVSYTRGDKEKDRVIAYLDNLLKSYELNGRIEWRIGGRVASYLFKSAEMLNYIVIDNFECVIV